MTESTAQVSDESEATPSRFRRVLAPVRGISNTEKTAAALLLTFTIIALVWANWP